MNNQSDVYFVKAGMTAKHNPFVRYVVFQKRDAILCGSQALLRELENVSLSTVRGLKDGTAIHPGQPTHIIDGYFKDLVELETIYLGILAEETKIATNVREAVQAARGKPVLFFPARFALPGSQTAHGYAAYVGGASGCSTQEQTDDFNNAMYNQLGRAGYKPASPSGTMPHALIAAFDGDTVAASLAFAEQFPDEAVFPLVDFTNQCATTAVACLKAFQEKGIAHRLAGVRLDTSEKLTDQDLQDALGDEVPQSVTHEPIGYTGVCPELVRLVRTALNDAQGTAVKICVSGGFSPAKIKRFEDVAAPVDVYAVGEYFLQGSYPFTSDIVQIRNEDGTWRNVSKVGRGLLPEPEGFETLHKS